MATMYGMASRSQSDAIQRISDAADEVDSAKQGRMADTDTLAVAENELRAVVQAAHDRGVSWQSIGDALGIRRGAAYQRFRRRSGDTDARATDPRTRSQL